MPRSLCSGAIGYDLGPWLAPGFGRLAGAGVDGRLTGSFSRVAPFYKEGFGRRGNREVGKLGNKDTRDSSGALC